MSLGRGTWIRRSPGRRNYIIMDSYKSNSIMAV